MSSKSRKKSPGAGKRKPHGGVRTSAPGGIVDRQAPESIFAGEKEIVHVPRETSKLRFVLMIGLVILLLVIFLVPGAIFGTFSGGGGGESVGARFRIPGEDPVEIESYEFIGHKRLLDAASGFDPFLPMQLGIEDRRPTDEDVARLLLLDRLALDAGLHVSNADLASYMRSLMQALNVSVEQYNAYVRSQGTTPAALESMLRRSLRARRYLQLVGQVAGIPDPAAIEELWHQDHREYDFEYATLATEGFRDAARDQVPGDEELEEWFQALPEARRASFRVPERRLAEYAYWVDPETTSAAGLLERYPMLEGAEGAEGTDPEERASDYYDRVFFLRFRRPPKEEPAEDTEGAGEDGAGEGEETPPAPESPYLSQEEVHERLLAEAPAYFAFEAWLKDLRERRQAGEEVDLEREAQELGLAYAKPERPLSRADYAGAGPAEQALADAVFRTPPETLAIAPVVGERAIGVVRTLERVEPAVPPFEEIRETVEEAWAEERAGELALERLEEVRAGFSQEAPANEGAEGEDEEPAEDSPEDSERRFADAEAFAAALAGLDVEVQRIEALDKAAAAAAKDAAEPARAFVRAHSEYWGLEVGEVPPPALDRTGDTAYLVRLAETREVPLARMTPQELGSYEARAAGQTNQRISQGQLDPAYLRSRYELWVPTQRADEDEAGDGADGAGAEE
jgi:hypothetical protein